MARARAYSGSCGPRTGPRSAVRIVSRTVASMWPPPSGPRHTPSRAPVLYAPPGISRRASMPASLPTNSPTTTQRENAAPFRAQALPRGVVGLEGGPAADQVGGPLGDRDRGGAGVAARDGRHDRRVHDPQPLDPADSQLGVADRVAGAHRAGAHRVEQGRDLPADEVGDGLVGLALLAGRPLAADQGRQRPRRGDLPRLADTGDQDVQVG